MRFRLTALIVALLAATPAVAGQKFSGMIEADVRGSRVEGWPLLWNADRVDLLGRDGRIIEFPRSAAKDVRKTSNYFRPFSSNELKGSLEKELGRALEITGTGHFLVAHPPGRGGEWADRFEELYRSFIHYFSVRGMNVREPRVPLVAIIFSDQREFQRYAAREGTPMPPGVLGYYSLLTNRVALFDYAAGRGGNAWRQNASTIVHEATHQTAFNTGVQSRFAAPPRWLSEGLGTLYEARGVWDSTDYPQRADRVNASRLASFREYLGAGRKPGSLADLVCYDRLFFTNPLAAYGECWALTFFLSETQPRQYIEYLEKTAARPAFSKYSAAQRLADFQAVFGQDLAQLERNFLEFTAGL